jgi:hypothetical protein
VRGHERRERELARRVDEAVSQVQTPRGLLPICASCRKIRDDKGYWNQMETYISEHCHRVYSEKLRATIARRSSELPRLFPRLEERDDLAVEIAKVGVPATRRLRHRRDNLHAGGRQPFDQRIEPSVR